MDGVIMIAGLKILIVCSLVFTFLSLYWSVQSYRRHKNNLFVSRELQKIIETAAGSIQASKKAIAASQTKNKKGSLFDVDGMVDSPDLLSTIVTVLIKKFGDARLSMEDFMISDQEYVSIYVDTETNEILLSANDSLNLENSFIGFAGSDDSTFH